MWSRAVLPLGIACAVELACAGDDAPGSVLDVDVPPVAVMPDAAEIAVEEPSLPFSPVDVWRVGQRWRTFAPKEPGVLTDFEVISIHDGVTTIRATILSENAVEPNEPPVEMQFDADGQRIGSSFAPDTSRLTDNPLRWPRFPLTEVSAIGDPPRAFPRQVVRRDGGIFTVVLEQEFRSGRGPNYFRRVFQWEVGRPWYDASAAAWSYSPEQFDEDLRRSNWETTIDWDLEHAPGSP